MSISLLVAMKIGANFHHHWLVDTVAFFIAFLLLSSIYAVVQGLISELGKKEKEVCEVENVRRRKTNIFSALARLYHVNIEELRDLQTLDEARRVLGVKENSERAERLVMLLYT